MPEHIEQSMPNLQRAAENLDLGSPTKILEREKTRSSGLLWKGVKSKAAGLIASMLYEM
jgi:hypothetical protein